MTKAGLTETNKNGFINMGNYAHAKLISISNDKIIPDDTIWEIINTLDTITNWLVEQRDKAIAESERYKLQGNKTLELFLITQAGAFSDVIVYIGSLKTKQTHLLK